MDYEKVKTEVEGFLLPDIANKSESFGKFYNLYRKETEYHELTLYKMFKNPNLCNHLLKKLFQNEYSPDFEIKNLSRQKPYRIDIYFEVNSSKLGWENKPVIIELKTYTNHHSGQLTKYYEEVIKGKGKEPRCFYITPAPKSNHPEKYENDGEKDYIYYKYEQKSYFDLVDSIDTILKNAEIQDKHIFEDYYYTVKSYNIVNKKIPKLDQLHFYYAFFKKLQDQLEISNIKSTIKIFLFKIIEKKDKDGKPVLYNKGKHKNKPKYDYAKENHQFYNEQEDYKNFYTTDKFNEFFNSNHQCTYITLEIWNKKGYKLAIEKKWEDWVYWTGDSLFYGIYDKELKDGYLPLVEKWLKTDDKLIIANNSYYEEIDKKIKEIIPQEDIKNKINQAEERDKISKDWQIAQVLSYWIMNYFDQRHHIYETDINTWVNWIKEDLNLIQ